MSKIKIMCLIATLDTGGAEMQLAARLKRIDRDRFDVLVCCLTRGGPVESLLREAGIPCTVLGKRFKLDFTVVLKLARLIRKENPDILHTFMFTSNSFGRAAGIIAGVPAVAASEECCDVWKTPLHFLVDRILLLRTDSVVCVSRGVKRFCAQKYGLGDDKAVVIYNGVEITPPATAPPGLKSSLGVPEDARVLLAAGRLVPQKGIGHLVGAMPDVLEQFPGARLLVAGDGPERGRLERLARDLGVSDRTVFAGRREDLPDLMAVSEMFVLPSLFEGFGVVLAEAMVREKPVVASDIPGPDEVVSDGETGILVPPASPRALSGAVRALLSDRDRASAMGRAGRRRAAGMFDINESVKRYQKLYESLYAKKNKHILPDNRA